MDILFSKIFQALKKYAPDKESLKPHGVKGLMSDIYTIKSDRGNFVIHASRIKKEQKRQKIWEKILGIGRLLDSFPKIPSASVVASGTAGKNYFIVQKMLDGKAAGERVIKNGLIVDRWHSWSKSAEKNIEEIIADINQIPLEGYGWLERHEKTVRGRHKSWIAFLEYETGLWFKTISKYNPRLARNLKRYFEANKSKLAIKNSYLVHGDITNPSNILLRRGKVAGFVDWEWSLAGDPAWEFAFNSRYSLKNYFGAFRKKFTEKEKSAFTERVKLYGPLLLAFYLHVWMTQDHPRKSEFLDSLKLHLSRLGF